MKLRNKLILSCAALAAVATTAFSTTFAWYTSNTEVTATDITAVTKNEGSDLLMISKDQAKWGTTISFSTESASFNQMLPVAYTTSTATGATGAAAKILSGTTTTTTPASGTEGQEGYVPASKTTTGVTNSEADTKYVEFTFYLKNAADTSKTVQMTFTNFTNTTAGSTDGLPSKSIIDSATNAKFLGEADTESDYTVNALRVLCADIEVSSHTTGNDTSTFTFVSENAYSLANVAKGASAYNYGDTLQGKTAAENTISAAQTSAYSARQYYSSVMKETLVDNSAAIDTTTITGSASHIDFTVPAASTAATKDNYIKVTMKLFLNGWDEACFDACQGQTFTFGLDFVIPQA